MQKKTIIKSIYVSFFFLLLVGINKPIAQTRISSPYSMYGIGELYFNNNFRNMGMGGLAIGFQNNTSVNYTNPASYAGLDTNSFVFESAVFSHLYEQNTLDQNQIANYSSIGNLVFAFPIKKWWSSAFGVTPYSAVGYIVADRQVHDELGTINYIYEGEGGIHQAFWGNSFSFLDGFSVGFNTSFLFGNYKDIALVKSDSANFYVSNQHRTIQTNGFMLNMGAQYKRVLSPEREWVAGIIFGNTTKLNAEETIMNRTYLPGFTVPDTTLNVVNEEGEMNLPLYWGAGFTYKLNQQWMAGADFYNQNWESFEMFGENMNLNNMYQIAVGARFSPEQATYSSFLTRANYFAGLRYKQTYIIHNNYPVDEYGISVGFNFRLRRSLSGMTFAFEWTNRGDIDNNMLREDIYRFNIGLNIHEHWFIKRKFY